MLEEQDPQADLPLVEFHVARTPFEARVVAGVLADARIPHFVDGAVLADEFAASQRLMNLQSVTVRVPENHLGAAREALEAAREVGRTLGDDVEVPAAEAGEHLPRETPRGVGLFRSPWFRGLTVLVYLAAPLLFVLWMDTRAAVLGADAGASDLRLEAQGRNRVWKDRATDVVRVVERLDDRGRVVWVERRDVEGEPYERIHDRDGDGLFARIETLDPGGKVVSSAVDTDGDGRFDEILEDWGGGRSARYSDTDKDGLWESLELRRGDELLGRQRFEPGTGWVDAGR